jgi:hypothetical protein
VWHNFLTTLFEAILIAMTDAKREILAFFDASPLPFASFQFLAPSDPPRSSHPFFNFFVEKVISELTGRYLNWCDLPHGEQGEWWNLSWGSNSIPRVLEMSCVAENQSFCGRLSHRQERQAPLSNGRTSGPSSKRVFLSSVILHSER